MFGYHIEPAASVTAHATPGSVTTPLSVRAGTGRMSWITNIELMGLVAAATQINSIWARFRRYTTASTGGTAITPSPKDIGNPAAKATAATAPSGAATGDAGVKISVSCGAGGPGGWTAGKDSERIECGEAGSGDSVECEVTSGLASAPFAVGVDIEE